MHQPAFFHVASACPTHTAVIDSAGSYTYQQLAEQARRVSAKLLGSERDLHEQRIAFLIKPGFNYVAAQWGIWRSGGVAVPMGTKHPPPELAYVIDDAEVSILIVPPELLDRVADTGANCATRRWPGST